MKKLNLNPEERKSRLLKRQRKLQAKYRKNHPEKIWAYTNDPQNSYKHRMKLAKGRYGLNPDEFDRLWKAQNGICGLCGKPEMEKNDLVIDHCHQTGKVRTFIHRKCNLMLGYAKEDVSLLAKAIDYLNRWMVIR